MGNGGRNLFDFECEKCNLRFKTDKEIDAHYIECMEEQTEPNELDEILRNNAGNKEKKDLNDESQTVQIEIYNMKQEKIEIDTLDNKKNEKNQKNILNGNDLKELTNPKRSNKKMIKSKQRVIVKIGIKSKKRKRIKTNNTKKNMDDAYIPRVKPVEIKRRKSQRLICKKQKNEKINLKRRKRLIDSGNKLIDGEPPTKRRKIKPKFIITIKRKASKS